MLLAILATLAIEINGRVLDADGKPAAKVPVTLTSIRGEPLVDAATDAEGWFRVSVAEGGMADLTVRGDGRVPMTMELRPLLASVDLPTLTLARSESLRIRAVDFRGEPRAGVRVTVIEKRRASWAPAARSGVTDAEGLLSLPRGSGERLDLVAVGENFPETRTRADGSTLELRAPHSCARRVLVRDAAGVAIRDAQLFGDRAFSGRTDADGAIVIATPCGRAVSILVATDDGRAAKAVLDVADASASSSDTIVTLEPPQRWSGRVLDAETRAPIAGALVWPDDEPAAFVRSDAKGGYAIALPRTEATSQLRAAATGHLLAVAKVVKSVPVFALQPTAALAGVVVDANGRAVPRAEVAISEWLPESTAVPRSWPEGLPSQAITRDDGAFRLDILPQRAHTVKATRAGFAPATITLAEKVKSGAVRDGLRIVLASGQSAFGKVVDVEGLPIADAEVRLVPASDRANLPRFVRGNDEQGEIAIRSDRAGTFRFEHLPAGRFDLVAKARGFAPHNVAGIVIGERPLDAGTLVLERGFVVEGIVVDGNERPLAGATVLLYPPSPAGIRGEVVSRLAARAGEAHEAVTGGDGRFSIAGIAVSEALELTVRRAGYVSSTLSQLELPPNEPLRIALEVAARVSGRVLTEQGDAVAGATVSVQPADASLPPGLSGTTAQTDAEGAFTFGELAPGKVSLTAMAKGFVSADAKLLDVRAGRSVDGVELTLTRGATIEGTVTTPAGVPAAGARITLRHGSDAGRMLAVEIAGGVRADGDGRYRIEGVTPGMQTVIADREGYVRATRDLEVRPGENRLDLRLGEGSGITGQIVDGEGRPLAGATVTLVMPGGIVREELSEADGAFRFAGLESGRYDVAARKEGYAPAQQNLTLAERPLDVRLQLQRGGAAIVGRISGLAPQELSQLRITAVEQPLVALDGMREGRADRQSAYRVDGVRAGEWLVTARLANGRQARKVVRVTEGSAETPLDLEFTLGIALTGTVRRGGQPAADAVVQVSGVGNDSSGSAITGTSGAFRIEGLKPGQHKLAVLMPQLGLRHERVVSLASDDEIDIELPTARARGRVVDGITYAPLAGVVVIARAAGVVDSFAPRTMTAADGSFTLDSLGKGSYRFSAQKEGYGVAEIPVQIPADDTSLDGLQMVLATR